MCGIVVVILNVPARYLSAATWKNSFNKHHDLKALYKSIPFPPHILDSALIGLYQAGKLLELPDYSFIKSRASVNKLVKRIAKKLESK